MYVCMYVIICVCMHVYIYRERERDRGREREPPRRRPGSRRRESENESERGRQEGSEGVRVFLPLHLKPERVQELLGRSWLALHLGSWSSGNNSQNFAGTCKVCGV